MKTIAAALVAITMLVFLASFSNVIAQENLVIKGRVTDSEGNPIEGVLVFAFDYLNLTIADYTRTDSHGLFKLNLRGGLPYVVYALKTGFYGGEARLEYIPARIDLKDLKNLYHVDANIILYRAATVRFKGRLFYVGGSPTEHLEIRVLTVDKKPVSKVLPGGTARAATSFENKTVKVAVLDTYGTVEDFQLVFKAASKSGLIPAQLLERPLVAAPAGMKLILQVKTTVIDKRESRLGTLKILTMDIGSPDDPRIFSPVESSEIDLTEVCLRRVIELVREDIKRTQSRFDKYEEIGFFLAAEREELAKAESLVNEAGELFERGESIDQVLDRLEKAFVIATDALVSRLNFMTDIAVRGASILPFFLSCFAAALAFYFFEDNKSKVKWFTVFYALLFAVFYMCYPGFPLIDKTLLVVSVAAAFLLLFFITFVLPRWVKEPEIPGRTSVAGLIAITFSIAKRYSRLKRIRTILTVFSLAALIWAFTVLASISTVWGLVVEEARFTSGKTGLLVKAGSLEEGLYPLGYFSDYQWFHEKLEVTAVAVRVQGRPWSQLSVIVFSGKGSETIKGVFAVSANETLVTGLPSILVDGDFSSIERPDAIILPRDTARKLGVRVGDRVSVRFKIPERTSQVFSFEVVGVFNPARLDGTLDLNGEPVKPVVAVNGKLTYANSTDVVLFNWKTLLRKVFPDSLTGFSKVASIYSIAVKAESANTLRRLARTYVERKGTGYYAWVASEKKCEKVYFGEKIENIFEKNIAFIIPILIVAFNVVLTMYSIVHERRKEIFIFNALGFNPTQIATIFLAESIVYGLLAGGLGYIAGLATFRILAVLASYSSIMVREKLEWYWSVIGVTMAILVSMISAFKPALNAALLYTPSKVKKIKVEEKEKVLREEEYLRSYTGKSVGLPGRIKALEAPIFYSYIYTRLKDLSSGYIERTEDVAELPEEELPDGTIVKTFTFNYMVRVDERVFRLNASLRIVKQSRANYYTVEVEVNPPQGEDVPVRYMDRVIEVVRDIVKTWNKEKKRLV